MGAGGRWTRICAGWEYLVESGRSASADVAHSCRTAFAWLVGHSERAGSPGTDSGNLPE